MEERRMLGRMDRREVMSPVHAKLLPPANFSPRSHGTRVGWSWID
jgi:hypothetical protein